MYEAFFGMEHTPFVRDVPPDAVYDAQRSPFCFRTAVFRSQRPPIFS